METTQAFNEIELTPEQKLAFDAIQSFLVSEERIYILRGYAGSGKTTLLRRLVEFLLGCDKKYLLMASTGRAAKILSVKTNSSASTIHSGIYNFKDLQEIKIYEDDNDVSYLYEFKLRNNENIQSTLFIVDESSMISNVYAENEFIRFGSGFLLNDLISYSNVLTKNSFNKILFVGDPAQLPPMGMNTSPALDSNYIFDNYKIKPQLAELKEVKRQDVDSGISSMSKTIRRGITSGYFNYFDIKPNQTDVSLLDYSGFLDSYFKSESLNIVICYKNDTVFRLNREIRVLRYGGDFSIRESDSVVITRNSAKYNIFNGDFAIITHVDENFVERRVVVKDRFKKKIEVVLRWRRIEMLLTTSFNTPQSVSGYMLENQLYNPGELAEEVRIALYIDFKIRNSKLKSGTAAFIEGIQDDEFFNCIMLRFGYAVTCHKAQGGEWDEVFVFWDYGTRRDDNIQNANRDYKGRDNSIFYRWAYTAVTRATSKLICINPPYFTPFSKMQFIGSKVQKEYDKLSNNGFTPVEVELNDELKNLLSRFGVDSQNENVYIHFIQRWYHLKKMGIEIDNWLLRGYEIFYQFSRDEKVAGIKYWINKSNHFSNNFQVVPKKTNSEEFSGEVMKVLSEMKEIIVIDNQRAREGLSQTIDGDIAESKPFLRLLFEKLIFNLPECRISQIEHFEYRERYHFTFGSEHCVVDFEYDDNGFFGRVFPLESKSRGNSLIERIRKVVSKIKEN